MISLDHGTEPRAQTLSCGATLTMKTVSVREANKRIDTTMR